MNLRDRCAIITRENIIFRVYGYFHPPEAYVCDVEYAPGNVFRSTDPRALREDGGNVYYKFYGDEGLRFVREGYPQHMVFYEPLQECLVGVQRENIVKALKPEEKLQRLMEKGPTDDLLRALHEVFKKITTASSLGISDFGVFGSLLHGFHHPRFSDLDLIVYGKEKLRQLRETLGALYGEGASSLKNEFESERVIEGKRWRFMNYTLKEFLWHQRRKMVYAIFEDNKARRLIKTEFEPVKDWREVFNEYSLNTRIVKKGWIKAVAKVTNDDDAPFMPSIYRVEPIKVLEGPEVDDVQRIISYVEEFRMQAEEDEEVYVEGNLEQVFSPGKTFHQITLTYGPRYYEQVLKRARM